MPQRDDAPPPRDPQQIIDEFLWDPTLDATNWRAEHALRPAVVTRKLCGGGNRTRRGADSQQVLASVLRTATNAASTPPTCSSPCSRRPCPRCPPA